MNDIIDINWWQLSIGLIFIIILIAISLYESLKIEKTILIGGFRTTVQLIFVGFLLQTIFQLNEWYLVLLILLVMLATASLTLRGRIKSAIRGTYSYAFISVSIASILTLIILTRLIIQVEPWYSPQYLIPLAGMVISNGMNGAALAGERYKSELKLRVPEIEMFLSLGYDSLFASKKARQKALSAALMPSLNNMMVMGIVSLPGMMTGQILAGNSPLTAVKYQLLIILAIAAAVLMASWILISILQKKFFTPYHQIRYDLIHQMKGD